MKNTVEKALKLMVAVVAIAALQGCGKSRMDFTPLDDNISSLGGPTSTNTNTNLTCVKEHYYQPTAQLTQKLDILFITDTSGSLNIERNSVATGIGNFISQLPANADYQIAVTLAHGPMSKYFGQLYKAGSEPVVLRSKELSLTDIRNSLVSKLTHIQVDLDTDGGEAGLLSLNQALEPTRLADIRAQNDFFRADAALAVVFISDENDICAVYPVGVTRVYDPEKKELPAFTKYCANKVDAASVYNRLVEVQGTNPLLVSAVIYSDLATVPHSGENEYGYGYSDIVKLANGTMVDMAANNIPAGLADIGKEAANKMNLRTDYILSYLNIDQSTITAEVDNTKVPFTFDATNNLLRLTSNTGKADSTVVLSYCLEANAPVTLMSPKPISKLAVDNPSSFVPQIEVVNQ